MASKFSKLLQTSNFESEDEDDEVAPAWVGERLGEDVAQASSSALRKRNVRALDEEDPQYAGKPVSRKQLEEEEGYAVFSKEDSEDDDAEEDSEGGDSSNNDFDMADDDNDDDDDDEDDDDEDGEDDDDEEFDGDDVDDFEEGEESMEMEEEGGVENMNTKSMSDDVMKGKCTQNQLQLWDAYLEDRIKLQKALQGVNKLPQLESLHELKALRNEELNASLKESIAAARKLMEALVPLQTCVLFQNKDTKALATGDEKTQKRPLEDDDDEEIPSDSEVEEEEDTEMPPKKKLKVEDYPAFNKKRHQDFAAYRDATIQKWYEKTKLSSKNLKKGFAAFEQSALKQIQQVMSDKDRLIKRTQVKRSGYSIIGKPEAEEDDDENADRSLKTDPEIFDDDDFYHQLLRELIERKTANIDDNVERTRQWLEIQKLRQKRKKKVDTRASKGRKIRYHVHKKMLNFMAPDSSCLTMDDDALDALFSSLPNNPDKAVTET